MKAILAIIKAWTFSEVLVFVIVAFFLYLIYLKLTGTEYCENAVAIKSKHKKRLRRYIRDSISSIHTSSMEGARKILKGSNPSDSDTQMALYDQQLHIILITYLQDSIFIALFENGFDKLSPTELDLYIQKKGSLLFHMVQEKMMTFDHRFPDIVNSPNARYKEEQAVKVYGDIVKLYLKLKKSEQAELNKLRADYLLIGKIIGFFKKNKDK